MASIRDQQVMIASILKVIRNYRLIPKEGVMYRARALTTVEFRQRLKDARRQRRLSQTQLAVILGVSYSALSRWEHGNRNPRAEHSEQVSRWLHRVDQAQTG